VALRTGPGATVIQRNLEFGNIIFPKCKRDFDVRCQLQSQPYCITTIERIGKLRDQLTLKKNQFYTVSLQCYPYLKESN
jgi:hypothetical protein